MTVKWVKLRRRNVGENKLRGFSCCFGVSCRRRPPSARRRREGGNCGGKRILEKEKQEKTRCANERLRVTEDVDVDN